MVFSTVPTGVYLPHARGDEPDAMPGKTAMYYHLPHARGDEPYTVGDAIKQDVSTPHTRGDEVKKNESEMVITNTIQLTCM